MYWAKKQQVSRWRKVAVRKGRSFTAGRLGLYPVDGSGDRGPEAPGKDMATDFCLGLDCMAGSVGKVQIKMTDQTVAEGNQKKLL